MISIRCIIKLPPPPPPPALLLSIKRLTPKSAFSSSSPFCTLPAAASSKVDGLASSVTGTEQSTAASFQPTTAQRHATAAVTHQAEEESAMEGQQNKPDQQPLKPIDPITKRYDDMHESYGEAYATRSSEEGFGGIYSTPLNTRVGGESKSASHALEDDMDPAKEPEVDFDHTQGSPVAEKERATRHGGAHGSAAFTSCSPCE